MSPVRFDAYTATVKGADPASILSWLHSSGRHGIRCAGDTARVGTGYLGFGEKAALVDDAGSEVASVLWGGRNEGYVMFEVKGGRTPEAVDLLRSTFPGHNCTRADSCVDFDAPGVWRDMLKTVRQVKADFRLWGELRGDPEFPELGLTQYLGAPSSTCRARLYEKGKQPDLRHLNRPNLVRLEVQVRPKKAARTVYSALSPLEVWGASPFTRALAARVLASDLQPCPAGTVYRLSSMDSALRWMCQQYGPHLMTLKADLGDWECVGRQLETWIRDRRGGDASER